MYKEEKIVEGVLCVRYSPESEFKPYTVKEISEIAQDRMKRIRKLELRINDLEDLVNFNEDD